MPIGIAYPVGLVEHRRGLARTYRLVVDKAAQLRRWICFGRRFIRLGEAGMRGRHSARYRSSCAHRRAIDPRSRFRA
jgi:hypothetical protein